MKNAFKSAIPVAMLAAFAGACTHHTIETSSEIKPIHIVIDVNVKVDKDLDNFFGKAPAPAAEQKAAQASQPSDAAAAKPAAAGEKAAVQAVNVSLEDALKFAPADNPPAKEVMMGRFAARRPVVKDLKARGIVGEEAKGLLAFVTDKKESESLITVENADRKLIFERVAKRQGSTVEKVAQLKGEKTAKEALPGEFIQDAAGKWTQKQ